MPKNKNRGHIRDDNNILLNSVRSKKQQQQPTVDVWMDFKEYLRNENQSTSSIKNKVCYAKRFYSILESMNAQDLAKLTPDVKSHAMKALASLSKFLGKYDEWLEIIKRYQLKWSSASNSSMKAFNPFLTARVRGKTLI